MIRKPTDPNSAGFRLGNFLQIRTIIDEELEQASGRGRRHAKEALDEASQARQRAARTFEGQQGAEHSRQGRAPPSLRAPPAKGRKASGHL